MASAGGIGPALARRIVGHRERFGPFSRVEELLLVDGFSEERFFSVCRPAGLGGDAP